MRHGESQVQVDKVVGGPLGCTGLSDLGRRQVGALRRRWERHPVEADVLLASTLPRAGETAEILAPVLGFSADDIDRREDLCELFPGESDTLTWEEFGERYRPEGWTYDPHEPMAPGAESWVAFHERVSSALEAVTELHAGRTVVVACHGGIVVGSMLHFTGLPAAGGSQWRVTNASVTEWVYAERGYEGEVEPSWRLERFNDAAHLEGLDAG